MRRVTRSATRSASGVEAVDASELQPDATSGGLALDVPKEALLDALTCPISGKLFVDPVTAVCGHTFSRRMLAKWMSQPGRQSSCPTCRAPLYHESPHQWPVNTTLADLCERFLNDSLREARDSEPKLDFPPFDSQYRGVRGGARDASLASRETRNRERGRVTHTGRRERRERRETRVGDDTRTLDDRDRVARDAVELPLFVLDPMVPGQEITLNVFEERYKRMVRRCMQHTRRFGMVAPADEHHEGATRAVTMREVRRREKRGLERNERTAREDENDETEESSAPSDLRVTRVYASSEEEEDALESSGDDESGTPNSERGVGRRVDPPAGPFAFLDHGVECVVTAFQEGIDGRVLVRCRATRHVKVLSAFEDEAGYAVARVVQVRGGRAGGVDEPLAEAENRESLIEAEARLARARAARACPDLDESPDESPARGGSGLPAWQTRLMGAVDAQMDMPRSASTRERDACRLRLRLERAVGTHRVWLAHVSGRRLEGSADAVIARGSGLSSRSLLPWSRARGSSGGDWFRRSYGGQPENLLALSGERPRADRPEALAWWLARVANPLPPLGAALELRGAALSASGVTRRFSRVHRGLVGSMRAVHGLAFEDFRGARPAAAAAVAIAWCRAVEASVRLDNRHDAEEHEEPYALPPRKSGARAKRNAKRNASAYEDEENAAAYEDAPRARNRHRFQFLVDSALRAFVESVSRYGDAFVLDDDDSERAPDAEDASGESVSWPAMRVSPLPGVDPRSLGGVVSDADVDVDVDVDGARDRRRRRAPDAALRTEMRGRIAFLVEKGGAPCAAWALYRHLSRFEDATFEALAAGIGWAIDPANRDFAFVRLSDSDDAPYASYDVIGRIPFFPADFAGSVPDDFPRPGDAARARAAVGVAPAARRAAWGAEAFGGGDGATSGSRVRGVGFFAADASAVAGWLFAARGVTHKLLDLALAAFAWTVAGIGHLVALALLALWTPLARASGRDATRLSAPLSFAAFGSRSDRSGTGADRFGTGVDDRGDVSVRERDRASSRERSRIASGAFALACAAALFLVLDSDEHQRRETSAS